MDDRRFDQLTEAFAKGSSRRSVLRGLVGGAAGAVLAVMGQATASAAPGGKGGGGNNKPDCCPTDHPNLCALQCVDILSDPNNCGGCATACAAGATCTNGVCDSCPSGTTLCGSSPGACVNTSTDNSNCGTCGTVCSNGQTCAAGQCTTVCLGNLTLCGGNCVDTSSDPTHCGSCANACGSNQVCAQGQCVTTCPSGTTNCSGACVSTSSDNNNCGTCGHVCPAGTACTNGTCASTCNCTAESPSTCGTTGVCNPDGTCAKYSAATVCSAAFCSGNTVQPTCYCNGGGTCQCPPTQSCGAYACQNGACLTHCASDADCSGGSSCNALGQCVAICPPGQTICGGTCVDTSSDNNNCGSCGTSCSLCESCVAGGCQPKVCDDGNPCTADSCDAVTGQCLHAPVLNGTPCGTGGVCQSGICTAACPSGETLCGGVCVNTSTNVANCGACGVVCITPNGVPTCSNGSCGIGACTPGFQDCNNNPSDGCEVNTNADSNNCGACNNVCPSGATCTGGICTCPVGETVCGNSCVDTSSDPFNCGGCGVHCPAGTFCTGGVCGP